MSDLKEKFAIYAAGGAAAGLVLFGFGEAASHLMSTFRASSMPPTPRYFLETASGVLGAFFASRVGAYVGLTIHRDQELGAFIYAAPYAAAGLLGGALGGWFAADKVLPPPHDPDHHSNIQQAAPNESKASALAKLPVGLQQQLIARFGA